MNPINLFEQPPLQSSPNLYQALHAYLTAQATQLHRYPEEEYDDALRAVAHLLDADVHCVAFGKTALEAFEFTIELFVQPGKSVLLSETHPYRAVLEKLISQRGGQYHLFNPLLNSPLSSNCLPQASLCLVLCDRLIQPEWLNALEELPVVCLDPVSLLASELSQPNLMCLLEWPLTEPVSLNPLQPVLCFSMHTDWVAAFRKVQEPFHVPTHLLVLMTRQLTALTPPFLMLQLPSALLIQQIRAIQTDTSAAHPLCTQIAEPIQAIKPYVAGKGIKAMARELQKPASFFSKLASNEHPFGLPEGTLAQLHQQLLNWESQSISYHEATQQLKQALLDDLQETQQYVLPEQSFSRDQVVLGTGSVEIIKAIIKAFVPIAQENQRVLLPAYPFAMYPFQACKQLSKTLEVSLNEGYRLSLTNFIQEIQEKRPAVIFLANPRNPLGTGIHDLRPLMEALGPEQVLVLDEAYFDFIRLEMGPETYPNAVALIQQYPDKNIIAMRTFSKSFALASFRLGYAFLSPQLVQKVSERILPAAVDPLTLAAGIAALKAPGSHTQIETMVRFVIQEKERFYEAFRTCGIMAVRSYANFIFFETGTRYTSQALFQRMVTEAGVIIRPVTERTARISIGNAVENDAFIQALHQFYLN